MKLKRVFISAVAIMLVVCLMPTALAATWYLEDGDITVIADENGQSVKQGENDAVEDNDIVITQRDSQTATDSTITISTEDDAEASITIKDVNIDAGANSAIDVGESSLNLTVEGENTLAADGDSAALHVSSGDLTIDGNGSLAAKHTGRDGLDLDSAKIGSDAGEDMTGNIHITGDVTVTTDGTNFVSIEDDPTKTYRYTTSSGAGIGSGAALVGKAENGVYSKGGNMTGTITIDGNAKVNAFSGSLDGAGIGTGYGFLFHDRYNVIYAGGEMSGKITIGGNADVTASAPEYDYYDSYNDKYYDGTGIGTGCDGNMSGEIAIGGNAKVSASSDGYGAGIGTGLSRRSGDLTGTITIDGNAKVSAVSRSGAGIGTGLYGEFAKDAVVSIGGNADVFAFSGNHDEKTGKVIGGDGAGIGAGNDGYMRGTVNIWGNAKVTAVSADDGSGIGCGDDGAMYGTVNITDNANVTAVGGGDASGIGAADEAYLYGRIIISGNASVIALAGSSNKDDDDNIVAPYPVGAAIGGVDNSFSSKGRIMILGNANVTTGIIERRSATRENPTGIKVDGLKGYIGNESDVSYGLIFISDTARVNGVSGSDKDGINAYINGGNGTDLIPAQVEVLPAGGLRLIIEKDGYTVSDTLYGGSTELPTAPGTYPITVTVTIDKESFDVVLGTIVIPEPKPDPIPAPTANYARVQLYKVTDRQGNSVAYRVTQCGGVLTVTVDEVEAKLTVERGGLFALSRQGIEKIVFVTKSAKSVVSIAAAMENGSGEFVLLHSSRRVSITLAGKAITADGILIKE